jgi:hypothetical protein
MKSELVTQLSTSTMSPFRSIQDKKQVLDWCASSFFDNAEEIEDPVV